MSNEEKPIKDLIAQFFNNPQTKGKYQASKLSADWEKVVGKFIAQRTKSVTINGKKLILVLDSPALRNEIAYNKEKVIDLVNAYLGEKTIKEIVIL